MAIRVTGMYSGLDTESIISELVSAKSVKKASLVKAQTKLSWKQDAWKALNTKIFDFYTNTLSNMRYQLSYLKKTTKISNTNAISVITSDNAVDGVRSVSVNELAKGATLTSGDLRTDDGIFFSGAATLAQLRKFGGSVAESANLSGSFRVVGAQGQYLDFEVNENTTIDDIVSMISSTGLNANYDPDSQRIFISSKNTGALNNFNLMANDEGGMNALACLGLLSASDIMGDDPANPTATQKWASYKTDTAAYEALIEEEIAKRAAAYKEENESLSTENSELADSIVKLKAESQELFDDLNDTDIMGQNFALRNGGASFSRLLDDLYKDGGLYDKLREAALAYAEVIDREDTDQEKIDRLADFEAAKAAYGDAREKADDFINYICFGPMEKVQAKDENGNPLFEADGVTPIYEQQKDEEGNDVFEDDGVTPVYVMARNGNGLNKEYEDAKEAGTITPVIQAKVDSINKWYNAFTKMEANKITSVNNQEKIDANTAKIVDNRNYFDIDPGTGEAVGNAALESAIRAEFDTRVNTAVDALNAVTANPNMFTASKVNAQDAEITVDGAKFTSMTNTFNINGLTLTVMEKTDKEITMTTSTDTDGIYDMIKNFFSEYNKLINEMDAMYNAESSSGYEPLTSEEKDGLSDSEIEEWEKKIKDSLLRRDSTLSSVSFGMVSILLQGAEVNGKQMYLSDFGINTLGYFKAKDNERNAYHIDGDPDDPDTKANDDLLKRMITNDPETVMDFFTKLSTNLYDKLTNQMGSTDYSSAFTVYNDKLMKSEYKDYTDKIKVQEEKLNAMMDKWYKKFSAMEVALSKLESRSNSLASILGG